MILPIIGPRADIPAPDINTNEETMGWIMDAVSMHEGSTVLDIVTGKPLELGGSLGRKEATGRGVMINTIEILKRHGIDAKGATVAVQGFGNVGMVAANLLNKHGCKITAISDVSGGLHNPDGLKITNILSNIKSNPRMSLLKNYEIKGNDIRITNQQLLELDVDVLIPAAIENQIHKENADNIKARIIVEGANGPITRNGDKILAEKNTQVVPDILANSGGVIVSYFEWVQSIQSFFWDIDEVNENLKKIMLKSLNELWKNSIHERRTLREVAFMLATKKIAHAVQLRGIFP
jgi:glutamate dehydrogenase/leucine dehydrogenase